MQLVYEPKHIRNMLDHVTTNDLFKFIISERIRKRSEIVNNISMAQPVCVNTDRARKFVLTATYVEDLFLR